MICGRNYVHDYALYICVALILYREVLMPAIRPKTKIHQTKMGAKNICCIVHVGEVYCMFKFTYLGMICGRNYVHVDAGYIFDALILCGEVLMPAFQPKLKPDDLSYNNKEFISLTDHGNSFKR